MERVRESGKERRYRKRDEWFLECNERERRDDEERRNTNCCGNNAKEANGKNRK